MSEVILERAVKRYGEVAALEGLDLKVREGEFLTLLGPSGCGKTTTLRLIAGFVEPTEGRILIGGEDVTRLPPQKRQIGMVFQDYALFPHLSVADNIGFGLKERGVSKDETRQRVAALLDLIHLPDIAERYPVELSGGQRQRVALARAVAYPPRVLLMDEPLGALDLKLRENMQIELRRFQKEMGITTIYVTHDQTEAMTMSDRIAVMNKGRLIQLDEPAKIYCNPRTRFVADFVGKINLLTCHNPFRDGDWNVVEYGCNKLRVPCEKDLNGASRVTLAIRPEHLEISTSPFQGADIDTVPARVSDVVFFGNLTHVMVEVEGGDRILVECRSEDVLPALGDRIYIGWDPGRAVVLDD